MLSMIWRYSNFLSDNMILVQIAPADLENALISHPEILDVAVTL